MGKDAGEAQQQHSPDGAGGSGGGRGGSGNGTRCCCGGVRLQCVAALLLGVAVLLSAVFWLPPFAGRGRGADGPDPGDELGDDIMASFRLRKTVPELIGNKSRLELDIYEEIGIPNSIVIVKLLHPLVGSNWTNVIFSIVPYPENLTISSTSLSILRASFMSLVVRQSTLHLTESLFGNASSFEVLKFPGGITVIPLQTAFLLQKPHATFNFTLNYPIYKIQDRTNELKDQMKAGLLLSTYENLYIKLTNSNGSTILPPTVVETFIFLEVGNHEPSVPRLKQLARTITNSSSSSGNLGLNHTVFGKVKQISLSSYLKHSLHTGGGSDAPSPAPMHHHAHHRHHHHRRDHDTNGFQASTPSPVHLPVPQPRHAPPPSGCPYGTNKPRKRDHRTPAAEPAPNSHHSASAASPPHPLSRSPASRSPHDPSMRGGSPVPPPSALPQPQSPLPYVSFDHAHPPTEPRTGATNSAPNARATRAGPAKMSEVAPAPHSSYATGTRNTSCGWVIFVVMMSIVMSLL